MPPNYAIEAGQIKKGKATNSLSGREKRDAI